MIFLYDTWFSVVLVRPKHKVKLPTQSADKWICMGKWAFKILADFFSFKNEKASDDWTFLPSAYTATVPEKRLHQESFSRGKETFHILLAIFKFRDDDYNLAGNTNFVGIISPRRVCFRPSSRIQT